MSQSLAPNAPKYAQELERRALRAEAALAGLEEGLSWLTTYLHSPKFNRSTEDGVIDIDAHRVNVDDVLARLADASGLSLDYEAAI